MNPVDRYAPPGVPVEAGAAAAPRLKFPWLLVLRNVIGGVLLLDALFALYQLSQLWSTFAGRALIDPAWSPWRILPLDILKLCVGLAMLARSRFSLVLTPLCLAGFLYFQFGDGFHGLPSRWFCLTVAAYLGTLAFQVLLLTRGMLR